MEQQEEHAETANTILIRNLCCDHPNSELVIKFSQYSDGYPPVIIREPADSDIALVCFDTDNEAKRALDSIDNAMFGPSVVYEDLFEGYFDDAVSKALNIPVNEKNWLISPPPSPPQDWKPATEGKISRTLPHFDLPPPALVEHSSPSEKPTYLIFQPGEEKTTKKKLPVITSCDY